MKLISIDASNLDREHICCALGTDSLNKAAATSKKGWMCARFPEGLRFRRLDERGKVFIEYLPLGSAWKPIEGGNWMLINCLWVSGRFKGQGWSRKLLDCCIEDARAAGMNGVCAVSSEKKQPFLTDKSFYEAMGFSPVDSAPPAFVLLALSLTKGARPPAFTDKAKGGRCGKMKGLRIEYSRQCPFMENYASLMATRARERGMPVKLVRFETGDEARACASPFGTLGIYWNGAFVSHILEPESKLDAFFDRLEHGES
jgi:GNAT superfamily N-acetyltransferase